MTRNLILPTNAELFRIIKQNLVVVRVLGIVKVIHARKESHIVSKITLSANLKIKNSSETYSVHVHKI